MDLLVTCACGHEMTVSEYAAGMTAPCPKCGQPLTVSPQNSKPIARESVSPTPRPVPAPSSGGSDIQYTPLQTSSLKSNCARCGREFRGDWDRHQSAAGLVCNICWNLVQQTQDLQSTGYVAPVDSMKLDPVLDPQPQQPVEVEEVEKSWREKYWPDEAMMRRIAIGGAVAFGLYTVWLFISGAWEVGPSPEDLENAAAIAESTASVDLPKWAVIMMTGMEMFSGFVSTFIGLYFFLTLSNRLPEESFLANVVRLLPATFIVSLLYFAGWILPIPFIGVVLSLLFAAPAIYFFFGFEAQDIINFPIGMALGIAIQVMSYLLIHWFIAEIAL